MHLSEHDESVTLPVHGIREEEIYLHWEDGYNDQKSRAYADMQYTTEHGAVCLSVMLTLSLTPYTVIERSRKGTGIDYWLGDNNSLLFQKRARLEVSGILKGDVAAMNRRCASKTEQATQSDGMKLPAYISVIEFGSPKALYVKKTL